ncbi:hypothetical protein O3M35_004822 [Rhynocoris fuscipes]|uniref:Coiled-coil and C2 domain-containing protein 1-like n=1 Tax=Rhynocoris fuscipes TaxID=488301 RepID=A0AAW1DJR4_9HEMI
MSRQRRDVNKKQRTGNDLSQFGIFAVPEMGGMDDDIDDEDEDLEAELMSIISSNKPKAAPVKKKVVPPTEKLDKMVAESMKDIPSDASLSGDEDDPALLAELSLYTGEEEPIVTNKPPSPLAPITQNQTDYVALISERLSMYQEAEKNATEIGDSSKVRRISRGLKTLNDLLKKAKAGVVINEEDIPMPIVMSAKKPPEIIKPVGIDFEQPGPSSAPDVPLQPETPEVLVNVDDDTNKEDEKRKEVLSKLCSRRDEYKKAAVLAKRSGNTEVALAHVKIIKQFDAVIAAVEEGTPVDLSTMPPPPLDENLNSTSNEQIQPIKVTPPDPTGPTAPTPQVLVQSSDEGNSGAPLTVLEALEQRLNKFLEQEEAGKKDGNMSKARRMGRIVKQYQDAIKLHKAGKPIPVDELPTPPGFPPIPVENSAPKPSPAASPLPSKAPSPLPSPSEAAKSEPASVPSKPPRLGIVSPPAAAGKSPTPARSPRAQDNPSTSHPANTRQEKQLLILRTRQKQYKEAALKAKKSGDVALAKEYLRQSKCFDPLIEATLSGLPVDLSTIPSLPGGKEKIEKEYEIVKISDCIPGTTSEIYSQLISDLQKQLQMCMETRAHFKAMGDVGNANKFEQLAINTKKDYDTVKIACNKDDPVPRFHYEKRSFSIVRCNTDLTDNEFELSIIQGINYNVPNPREIDTYVRFDFPYPTDNHYIEKTPTVYNTNNPEYNSVFKIDVQRSNRTFQRIFKRQAIKFEIWSKGGFLRSDNLIGTVSVKLQPLETKCTIHDSFDLMDGRKVVGGKLEIKARIRNPMATKQVETLEEKWLVID